MKEKIVAALKEALDEINPVLDMPLTFSENLKLTDGDTGLDSMALVSFITAVEDNLSTAFGREIKLVSDKAFSRKRSPFLNMETLTEFIEELLQNEE